MKIREQLFYWVAFLILAFTACQEKEIDTLMAEGNHPVVFSGISTRSTDANSYNTIYIRGNYKDEDGNFKNYFLNTMVENITLSDTPQELTLTHNQYYPIGDNEIHLFGFTNNLSTDGSLLNLRAGYDELLANYGTRAPGEGETAPSVSVEGEGAVGSSSRPVETLFFRHVMTQITVSVEVEDPDFEGTPESIAFRMNELVGAGIYPITAKDPDNEGSNPTRAIKSTEDKYTLQLGVNYVVPTGDILTGQPLTYLKIDDYVATAEDLSGFTIGKASTNNISTDLVLLPGYAYNLIFKVHRLQVTGIEIKKTDWMKEELKNDDITFIPKILEVDFDEYYDEPDNDPIIKIILYTEDRQYVGEPGEDLDEMEFTLLPQGEVKAIELYTKKGVLLQEEFTQPVQVYDNITGKYELNIALARNGMMQDAGGYYLVTTAAQFIKISKDLAGNYKQIHDLEMDGLNLPEELNSFGDFHGIYDGQGYRINKAQFKGGGIFEENNGTIKNMRITGGTLDATGQAYAGVICQTNNGTITGCVNEARITGSQGTIGGICGLNEVNGVIIGCVNSGNMESGTVAGGICGENNNTNNAAILACINTGRVVYHYISNHIHGGICGESAYNNNDILTTCFWLNGTAAYEIGGKEYAVGNQPDIIWNNVADVSPAKLKNKEVSDQNDQNEICRILNEAIGMTAEYEFIVNGVRTGSIWPIPVIK